MLKKEVLNVILLKLSHGAALNKKDQKTLKKVLTK